MFHVGNEPQIYCHLSAVLKDHASFSLLLHLHDTFSELFNLELLKKKNSEILFHLLKGAEGSL